MFPNKSCGGKNKFLSIVCNLKERLIEPFGSIKRSDLFSMKNKMFINHLHPLAILVVWTFRDFECVKVKKNEKKFLTQFF